jgi:hypothetical protein
LSSVLPEIACFTVGGSLPQLGNVRAVAVIAIRLLLAPSTGDCFASLLENVFHTADSGCRNFRNRRLAARRTMINAMNSLQELRGWFKRTRKSALVSSILRMLNFRGLESFMEAERPRPAERGETLE